MKKFTCLTAFYTLCLSTTAQSAVLNFTIELDQLITSTHLTRDDFNIVGSQGLEDSVDNLLPAGAVSAESNTNINPITLTVSYDTHNASYSVSTIAGFQMESWSLTNTTLPDLSVDPELEAVNRAENHLYGAVGVNGQSSVRSFDGSHYSLSNSFEEQAAGSYLGSDNKLRDIFYNFRKSIRINAGQTTISPLANNEIQMIEAFQQASDDGTLMVEISADYYASIGLLVGDAPGVTEPVSFSYYTEELSYTGVASFTGVAEVPVPAAAWLFGSALLGLAGHARKRA